MNFIYLLSILSLLNIVYSVGPQMPLYDYGYIDNIAYPNVPLAVGLCNNLLIGGPGGTEDNFMITCDDATGIATQRTYLDSNCTIEIAAVNLTQAFCSGINMMTDALILDMAIYIPPQQCILDPTTPLVIGQLYLNPIVPSCYFDDRLLNSTFRSYVYDNIYIVSILFGIDARATNCTCVGLFCLELPYYILPNGFCGGDIFNTTGILSRMTYYGDLLNITNIPPFTGISSTTDIMTTTEEPNSNMTDTPSKTPSKSPTMIPTMNPAPPTNPPSSNYKKISVLFVFIIVLFSITFY